MDLNSFVRIREEGGLWITVFLSIQADHGFGGSNQLRARRG